jgi:hypothetical protein
MKNPAATLNFATEIDRPIMADGAGFAGCDENAHCADSLKGTDWSADDRW